jgi:hypothetical protein
MEGVRHLVQCHCILPQFRKRSEPVFHKFVVFSIVDDEKEVVAKFAQCNNCSAVHRIVDLCRSEIVHNVEDTMSIMTISDIKKSLTPDLISILESHNCDISIWENVKFILDNDLWGESVAIAKDEISGSTQVKILTIKSESRVKVESHIRQDELIIEGDQ